MSKKDNHHFVPAFYLRNFSSDPGLPRTRKSITLWNLKNLMYVEKASIRDQASLHKYYDPQIEDALGILENRISNIISDILKTTRPPGSSEDRVLLCVYIALQLLRTQATVTDFGSVIDDSMKAITLKDPRIPSEIKKVLPSYKIRLTNLPSLLVQHALHIAPLIFDLGIATVVNESKHGFFTSDNPVVIYNQLMESRGMAMISGGLANPGLQIFFPISPDILLVLSDNDMYSMSAINETARVEKIADVNRINGLQMIRAQENVYLSSIVGEYHISRMHNRWYSYRRPRTSFNELTESANSSLLVTQFHSASMGLELSFISFKKDPESIVIGPTMYNPRNDYVERVLENIRPFSNKLRLHSTRKKELNTGGQMEDYVSSLQGFDRETAASALGGLPLDLATTIAMLDDDRIMSAFDPDANPADVFLELWRRVTDATVKSTPSRSEREARRKVQKLFERNVQDLRDAPLHGS